MPTNPKTLNQQLIPNPYKLWLETSVNALTRQS